MQLDNANARNYLILFILWPFLAFLLALKNYARKESRIIVYMFLIYYGFTFVNDNQAVDAYRYALSLKANALLPFSDFFKIVTGIYATDTSIDIVEPFISFVISRFTDYTGIYFAVWAGLFGFFYIKSINLLYEKFREHPGWNGMIFLAYFVMVLPITSISGVRMWTAAWIFFYGAYHVIVYRKSAFLLLALASSLVHWSFLSANAVLFIYFLAGNRNVIYLPLALASFVLPQLLAPTFRLISMRLGGALQDRYEGYSNEQYILGVQESNEQAAWFMQIGNNLVFYFLILTIVIIQLKYRNLMKEKHEQNLFSFLLLFLSLVNFGKAIPSFGGRFQILFLIFATAYVFFFFIKLPGQKLHFLTWLGILPMFLHAVITFRIGSGTINALIFAPGMGLPFFVPISLAELLF